MLRSPLEIVKQIVLPAAMLIVCLALYAEFNVQDRDFNNNGRDETGEYKSSGIIESYLMGFAFVSVMQTTLVAVVNVLATWVAQVLMDRCGRRTLLLWSSGGMCVSSTSMSASVSDAPLLLSTASAPNLIIDMSSSPFALGICTVRRPCSTTIRSRKSLRSARSMIFSSMVLSMQKR